MLQMQGSNVAPFTLGKQNLLLHTLRQLEKQFFVDHQFFRLGVCSHSEQSQQANATLIIVQNTLESGSIGLEWVGSLVCHSVHAQQCAALEACSLFCHGVHVQQCAALGTCSLVCHSVRAKQCAPQS